MPNLFLISDHHFGHVNILTFRTLAGDPLRSFDDINHMNEHIVDKHNSVVKPSDKVYFGGDLGMKGAIAKYLPRMNGHKRLILGNHDYPDMSLYTPYFDAIYSYRILDRMMLTHIPIHSYSIGKNHANIHGHTHDKSQGLLGPKYFNICCEALDYTPIALEDLKSRVQKQLGEKW